MRSAARDDRAGDNGPEAGAVEGPQYTARRGLQGIFHRKDVLHIHMARIPTCTVAARGVLYSSASSPKEPLSV